MYTPPPWRCDRPARNSCLCWVPACLIHPARCLDLRVLPEMIQREIDLNVYTPSPWRCDRPAHYSRPFGGPGRLVHPAKCLDSQVFHGMEDQREVRLKHSAKMTSFHSLFETKAERRMHTVYVYTASMAVRLLFTSL